jgi:hypothetical protein
MGILNYRSIRKTRIEDKRKINGKFSGLSVIRTLIIKYSTKFSR